MIVVVDLALRQFIWGERDVVVVLQMHKATHVVGAKGTADATLLPRGPQPSLAAAKIRRITIGISRRNTTGSDLLGRRNTAFERRVVPEDQHENSREEREERDGQQPGGEPAGRVL